MEREKFEFTVRNGRRRGPVVLARLGGLELGAAADMADLAKHPKRNIELRRGSAVIRPVDIGAEGIPQEVES